jgi:hypothetical protein
MGFGTHSGANERISHDLAGYGLHDVPSRLQAHSSEADQISFILPQVRASTQKKVCVRMSKASEAIDGVGRKIN